MKKNIFLILILTYIVISCEKDDFCTQNPITPKLILRFYDKDATTETKNVERLSIITQGKSDSLFTNQNTDSIAIPLNSSTQETVYKLKMNAVNGSTINNKIATLTIKYTPKEEFVSRSCGYRIIFNNVSFEKTLWIDNLSTSTLETINNQTNAHVKVYH